MNVQDRYANGLTVSDKLQSAETIQKQSEPVYPEKKTLFKIFEENKPDESVNSKAFVSDLNDLTVTEQTMTVACGNMIKSI